MHFMPLDCRVALERVSPGVLGPAEAIDKFADNSN